MFCEYKVRAFSHICLVEKVAPFFKNLITGPEGSTVRLKMLRGKPTASALVAGECAPHALSHAYICTGEGSAGFGYELELFRGTPEYFAGTIAMLPREAWRTRW